MNNVLVLDEVLEKLARHTTYPNYELIISDDGSSDGSLEVLRRWRASGRIEHFTLLEREHGGIIPTLNAAVGAAGGEVIVRIDGDTTVETPGWLEKMLDFHLGDERIGVTVAKIILDSGHLHTYGINIVCPEGMHDRGTFRRAAREDGGGAEEWVRPLEHASPLGDQIAEVDSALGCWTMFTTELFHELGGVDPAYNPVWYEDIDFGFTARTRGKKVFFFPNVRVVHHIGRRDPRFERSRARLMLIRANRRAGRLVPAAVRRRVAKAAKLGERDPQKELLLERHRSHWRQKWGFDPVAPDLAAIGVRYGDSEVCWASDAERRTAGEEIIARYGSSLGALSS